MKTNLRYFLLAGFFVGVLVCCSCKTVNVVEPATPVGTKQVVADRRILSDPTLNRIVNIVGLNVATTEAGFLKVQVEVFNKTASPQNFKYKFEWLDMTGMMVSTPTSVWIERQIQGRESILLSAVAPSPTVKDFRIKFIEK